MHEEIFILDDVYCSINGKNNSDLLCLSLELNVYLELWNEFLKSSRGVEYRVGTTDPPAEGRLIKLLSVS